MLHGFNVQSGIFIQNPNSVEDVLKQSLSSQAEPQ